MNACPVAPCQAAQVKAGDGQYLKNVVLELVLYTSNFPCSTGSFEHQTIKTHQDIKKHPHEFCWAGSSGKVPRELLAAAEKQLNCLNELHRVGPGWDPGDIRRHKKMLMPKDAERLVKDWWSQILQGPSTSVWVVGQQYCHDVSSFGKAWKIKWIGRFFQRLVIFVMIHRCHLLICVEIC